MLLLGKPYVSPFLQETIRQQKIPVCLTDDMLNIDLDNLSEKLAASVILNRPEQPVLTNSENAINWILKNLRMTDLPHHCEIFKNKSSFRELTEAFDPDFFHREIRFEDIEKLDITELKMPFIIKPSIGFFSLGVHKISTEKDWHQVQSELEKEIRTAERQYPKEVFDSTHLIIEDYIEGDEYAVDAFFDNTGKPVILNILKHEFSDETAVDDRLYLTSKEIIEKMLQPVEQYLNQLNSLTHLKRFPLHAEFRMDQSGKIRPVEINPMRFAGWCTTDIAHFAYQINPYEYFFKQKNPDWKKILKDLDGKTYSIIILSYSGKRPLNEVKNFHYEILRDQFQNILEMRQIDFRTYPVFAFLFTETDSKNLNELERILHSDLSEFIEYHSSAE